MEPLLKENDIVYIKKISFHIIKINDIVAIKKFNKIITHRVIYKTNSYIITKGDNNLQSDGHIYPRQILGVVYKVKRGKIFFRPDDIYFLQSSLYFQEILKIKKAFERYHINYVFLKGLPVYMHFQKKHPRRIYGDCDILIYEKDKKTIFSLFKKLGYSYISAKRPWSLFFLPMQKQKKFNFFKNIGDFFIVFDMHTMITFMIDHLGHLPALFPEKKLKNMSVKFLTNKQIVSIQGEIFPLLSNNHLALYSALHIFNHNYELPFRYELLAQLVKKKFIRYKNLTKEIRHYRIENFVYPSFFFLKKYFMKSLPDQFLLSIEPKEICKKYTDIFILNKNIFQRKSLVNTGIERFLYSFVLSPRSFHKKLFIFFDVRIVAATLLVIGRKILIFFKNMFFLQKSNDI